MAGNINFVPMSSYDLEGQEIARRRKMAEMLQAQSMAPVEQQSVGGMVAPISITHGLAKLLQGYSARKGQEAADAESKALGTRYQADLTNTLQRAQEAMTGSPATVTEDAMGNGSTVPERKPDRNAYISALMAHPATMPLAMQAQQKEIERQSNAAQLAQILGMGNQAPNPGAGAALAAEQAAGGAAGPTTAAAARLPVAPGPVGTGMGQISPQAIALMLQGGPMAEIGKAMQAAQGDANKPIAARENAPIVVPDGQGGFRVAFSPAPKLDQGMVYDFGNRSVSVAPGFIPSMTAIEGSRTGAVEAAKAPYQLVTVPQSDQSTATVPLPQALQRLGGAPGGPTPAGGPAPGGPINNPGNMRPPGQSTGFQRFETPEAGLQQIDKQLQLYGQRGLNTVQGIISTWAPPNENDTANYVRVVAQQLGISPTQQIDMSNPVVRQQVASAIVRMEQGPQRIFGSGQAGGPAPQQASAPVFGRTATAAEKQAQENSAATDRQRMEAEQKRAFNMSGINQLIDDANGILSGSTTGKYGGKGPTPTSSAIGSGVDTVAAWFGASPSGADQAQKLKVISGALVGKVPRFEGPQSNIDVALYKEMAGNIGDSTLPLSQRKAALEAVRQMWSKFEGQQPESRLVNPPDPAVRPAQSSGGSRRVVVDF